MHFSREHIIYLRYVIIIIKSKCYIQNYDFDNDNTSQQEMLSTFYHIFYIISNVLNMAKRI